jgi:primosomal protein N'
MVEATIHCPHCKAEVKAAVGDVVSCPSCGGQLRVHQPGADEKDEALRRLLGTVKIVERIDESKGELATSPAKPKRPWWKFWG